jgi:chemotaxis family two-component system sensor kinase Cph1
MLDTLAKLSLQKLPGKACLICKKSPFIQVHQSFKTQFTDFFSRIFDTSDWPPRWHCGTWSDFHGWMYIVSDLMIWASYFAIPILLVRMIKGKPDIPFPKIIWLFVAFIVFCGLTHLMDAIIFWWPAYRLSALIRLTTGVISAFTVYALYKIIPLVFSLRTVDELEHEIKQREAAEHALKNTHDMLLESHEQLRTFTHILSHNIRNHAANISSITTMIERDTLTETNIDYLNMLTKVSAGLNNTLDDLSDVIAVRDRKVTAELLSFETLYQQVTSVLASEIQNLNIQIITDFRVANVMFPKIYLESVMMNLISNSIKYRKENHDCVIRLKTYKNNGGKTVFECADNGLGIDLTLYGEKIFGLYHTFHKNKTAHGIGLFLIKTQIESQHGIITVDSKPGEGTTFTIIFNIPE